MLRTYVAAAVLVAAEAAMATFAMTPDVDPIYRSVYIDRETACYPVRVTGEYRLGSFLSFGMDQGTLRKAVVRCGLRDPDRIWNGSWSDGEKTLFLFADVGRLNVDLKLDVMMWPFLAEGLSAQRIVMSANGMQVVELILDAETPPLHTVSIPREIVAEGPLEIAFHYPDAISPSALGISTDHYAYAVFFRLMRLSADHPRAK